MNLVRSQSIAEQVSHSDPMRTVPQRLVADMETRRIRCYGVLTMVDLTIVAGAFLVANLLYLGQIGTGHGATMATILMPLYFCFAVITGAYKGDVLKEARRGALRGLRSLVLSGATILLIAYSFKVGSEFSRGVFWIGMLGASTGLLAGRYVLHPVLLGILGGTPFNTVIICDDARYGGTAHDVVLDADDLGFDPRTDDPVQFHRLANIVAHADRVIVACPTTRYADWSRVLKSMAVDGEILTDEDDQLGLIGVSRHGGQRTMVVSAGPLHVRDRIVKRVFDLVASSLALALFAPLLIGVAIAIKLESRGPVFFRQKRIGLDNKIFRIFKFRSMYADVCDADAVTLTRRGDSRVTRVGEFIRRTSIDELPQLLNVLRGEMSIVGPRPHAISAKAAELLYWEIDARYRYRHAIKPGLTGLAQVRGFRGATDRREDLTNRLGADLEYLSSWSMTKDLWIIARTFRVLHHNNAY